MPIFNKYINPIGTIFTLHRVQNIETNELPAEYSLKISPQFLESLIIFYKKLNYEFISLDELYIALNEGKSISKKILFTLDDGYIDNYENAYPIFKKYNIPFTIFICTSFPDKKIFKWWLILEKIIFNNEHVLLNNGQSFDCSDLNKKIKTYFTIRENILNLNADNLENYFNKKFKNYLTYFTIDNVEMSWEKIRILSQDRIVTIGGHTINHKPLKKQSFDEAFFEITHGNKIIEDQIGIKINHFAYPFGTVNECGIREFQIASSIRLKTAVTTNYGQLYSFHRYFLTSLPRINLTEKFDYFNHK